MQKQKRGFLLFICSLIPGAGEMYMGFFKQGISIMTLFWAVVAIAGGLNMSSLVILLPIIWFYSFFHVHNLKDLPEEEFYAVEDNYILHLDTVFHNVEKITQKQIKVTAVLLIVFGIAILWNGLRDLLYWLFPWISWLIYPGYYVSDSIHCYWNFDHNCRISYSHRKIQIFRKTCRTAE